MHKLPKRKKRNPIFKSAWIELYQDEVQMPNGSIIEKYHQLVYPYESVVVLPIRENGDVCFIKSLRYTTQKLEWELPAGSIDQDESINAAAKRECLEETGFALTNVRKFLSHNPSNGMSNEVLHLMIGEIDETIAQKDYDENEVAGIEFLTKKQIQFLVQQNIIRDGKSILPLVMYLGGLIP